MLITLTTHLAQRKDLAEWGRSASLGKLQIVQFRIDTSPSMDPKRENPQIDIHSPLLQSIRPWLELLLFYSRPSAPAGRIVIASAKQYSVFKELADEAGDQYRQRMEEYNSKIK